MNPALRHQLARIDRALLALASERARLLAEAGPDAAQSCAAVDDLLRRHAGPLPAETVREFYAVLDRGCAPGAHS